MAGITACGAYSPRRRLLPQPITEANAWFAPGLLVVAKGERAMANGDEDNITTAVEAGWDCLPADDSLKDRAHLEAIVSASTSMPFADRLNAGIAAVALPVGTTTVIVRFLASHTAKVDFMDHIHGAGEDFDYAWEERWVRDEGFAKIVPGVINGLLDKLGMTGTEIAHLILPFAKLDLSIVAQCSIDPAKLRDNLVINVGDRGAVHALLIPAYVLESPKVGEKILVVQFGQGRVVLLFEVTPEIADLPKRNGVSGSLAHRKEETNHLKYLASNDLIVNAVRNRQARCFVGVAPEGRCTAGMGRRQMPGLRYGAILAGPHLHQSKLYGRRQPGPLRVFQARGHDSILVGGFSRLRDGSPNHYGMVTFAEGGRSMADITDVEQGQIDSGTKVRMVFGIKNVNAKRKFKRYFWKGVLV